MESPQRARPVLWPLYSFQSISPRHQAAAAERKEEDVLEQVEPGPPLAAIRQKRRPHQENIHEDFHLVLAASFLLTFNAGFINMITLNSYYHLATAHVTGLVAKTSQNIGRGDWVGIHLTAVTWAAFLLGSFISGIMISYQNFYLGRAYGRALLLIALFQAAALVIGVVNDAEEHQYIYLCALACGLQNGLTSKYSGNVVRTTHMTGATTDLGVVLGHVARGKWDELWKVRLHGTALLGFLLGGITGEQSYQAIQEMSLAITVCVTTILAVTHIAYLAYTEDLRPLDVMASVRDIKIHRSESKVFDSRFLESHATNPSARSIRSEPDPANHDTIGPLPSPSALELGKDRGSYPSRSLSWSTGLFHPNRPGSLSRQSSGKSEASSGRVGLVVDEEEFRRAVHGLDDNDSDYSPDDLALEDKKEMEMVRTASLAPRSENREEEKRNL